MNATLESLGTMHGEDRRSAERFSLLMKTAKLVCQSGEFACICRDISSSGIKLKLFHPLPPEQHFLLELANGERYAMQIVWEENNQAGFRFAEAIDVAEFAQEPTDFPRRSIRLRIDAPATLTIGDRRQNARLVNISQHGACIETGARLPERQRLTLAVDFLPVRESHIRWRNGFMHGLVFQQGFTLAELAGHAFTLQPFGHHDEAIVARPASATLRHSA
ncbi:MAG: PilZ domain-containing protein [Sphingomonadaceae bacterium]|jgi:hypothetical protein